MMQQHTNQERTQHHGLIPFGLSLLLHSILFGLVVTWLQDSSASLIVRSISASVTFTTPPTKKSLASTSRTNSHKIAKKAHTKKSLKKDYAHQPLNIPNHEDTSLHHSQSSSGIALQGVENHNDLIIPRPLPLLINGEEINIPYPAQARARHIEGVVKMKLTVAETGEVISADIISGPAYGLRQAALMVARKLFFLPATDDQGRARTAQIEHEVIFRLTSS